MRPMLMGIETEYALSACRAGGGPPTIDHSYLVQQLLEITRERCAWLPDTQSNGMFLGNGARFYVDAGDHPEYSTPECASPREVVCSAAAGASILEGARLELERRTGHEVLISQRNVDYRSGRTWGCHESYSHACLPDRMWQELLPHLVTRIIYTGAGGFDSRSRTTHFQISPRVPHLRQSFSSCSTRTRAIVHMKDEPLCREEQYRLHLICGEGLYSQSANLLKIGTTALLVRLIDAGRAIGSELAFARPLTAMRAFSRDTRLKRRAAMRRRGLLGSLQVQRLLLERVEGELGEVWMPDWAEAICKEWRSTLELLATEPEATAPYLDWSAKYALFAQHREARRRVVSEAALQNELYEIDARYAAVGAGGIAHALEQAGVLAPPVIAPAEVERARAQAPAGRAARRGARIRELTANATRYRAQWDTIIDRHEHKSLALPLDDDKQEDWKGPEAGDDSIESERFQRAHRRYREMRERMRALTEPGQPGCSRLDEPDLPF